MIKHYGTQQPGKQPSEAAEMTTFFGELKRRYPDIAGLALHIRNENDGDYQRTKNAKMEGGFIRGAPDIVIMGKPTFLCEMKSKSKKSVVSKDQLKFLENADKRGCFCCVAYGWEAAMQAVEDWVKTPL